MKRLFAALIALVLLVLPFAASQAAETGELLIASETVTGTVGEVIKVNFFLYPNLPEGRKLDTLSGSMHFDPEFLTFGAINQVDEENNLTSLMKGKASNFQYNEITKGEVRFGFIDAYGVEAEGFWFQAEFRIEKEGATDFVFNGISYTGLDSNYKTISFVIDPVSVGGVYTEGQQIPEDGAADVTFAPLEPVIETPAPVTPTPRPSNSGQTVPVVSALPTFSAQPSSAGTGLVTPQPPQTPMQPALSAAPHTEEATPQAEVTNEPVVEVPTEAATAAPSDDPITPAEQTALPIGEDPQSTGNPQNLPVDPTEPEGQREIEEEGPNMVLVIGVIVGIVAVIGLGALAIVLVLKRRNAED